jgi:hypothetical protein
LKGSKKEDKKRKRLKMVGRERVDASLKERVCVKIKILG